jgi:hypothetical protein
MIGMSWQRHKKSLCEEIGHRWEPTTTPTVRRCSRSRCTAVQSLRAGTWVEVSATTDKKPSPCQQTAFWTDREVSG